RDGREASVDVRPFFPPEFGFCGPSAACGGRGPWLATAREVRVLRADLPRHVLDRVEVLVRRIVDLPIQSIRSIPFRPIRGIPEVADLGITFPHQRRDAIAVVVVLVARAALAR